jgi:hypothetical protein
MNIIDRLNVAEDLHSIAWEQQMLVEKWVFEVLIFN